MTVRVLKADPPRHLAITWGENDLVSSDFEPQRGEVLLTLVHRRLLDHPVRLSVASGWQVHLGVLDAKLRGRTRRPSGMPGLGSRASTAATCRPEQGTMARCMRRREAGASRSLG